MGQSVFEDALVDPESLVGPASDSSVEDVFFMEIGVVALDVYEELTNEELDVPIEYPDSLVGAQSPAGELANRFPRLWECFQK